MCGMITFRPLKIFRGEENSTMRTMRKIEENIRSNFLLTLISSTAFSLDPTKYPGLRRCYDHISIMFL